MAEQQNKSDNANKIQRRIKPSTADKYLVSFKSGAFLFSLDLKSLCVNLLLDLLSNVDESLERWILLRYEQRTKDSDCIHFFQHI